MCWHHEWSGVTVRGSNFLTCRGTIGFIYSNEYDSAFFFAAKNKIHWEDKERKFLKENARFSQRRRNRPRGNGKKSPTSQLILYYWEADIENQKIKEDPSVQNGSTASP